MILIEYTQSNGINTTFLQRANDFIQRGFSTCSVGNCIHQVVYLYLNCVHFVINLCCLHQVRTPDMGGYATRTDLSMAVIEALRHLI